MNKQKGTLKKQNPLTIEESAGAKIVQWDDIRDTEMLDRYFKQRLGPGFRLVPVVSISRNDFLSLIRSPDGHDIYARMCAEDPDAGREAAFTYSPQSPQIVNITFHIETQNPGADFLRYLNKNASCDLHKLLIKHLLTTQKLCHALHLQWKNSGVKYHKIR